MATENEDDGLVRVGIAELREGDRVDLEGDPIANSLQGESLEHPEFEFEYEMVLKVTRETDDCILVEFESGFACGFPVDHVFKVDAERPELGPDAHP